MHLIRWEQYRLQSPVSTFRLHQLSTGDDVKSYHDLLPPTGFTALTAVPTKPSKYYRCLFTKRLPDDQSV